MSELDRLVRACLLPGFAGGVLPAWVEDGLGEGLAGVCLYGQNLAGSRPGSAVPSLSAAVRAARPDAIVALDEEGGDVTRLEYRVGSSYPGNLALGTVDDEQLTTQVARAIGHDLRRAGVNLDLAPSVDVNSDPRNPVIGVRSFGADPALVARHGAAYIAGLRSAGVGAVAKHFPGHGATTVDSHLALPTVDADAATFRRRELPPFVAAVEAGVDAVMTSHVVFPALDARPATLSRRLLVDLLRGDLGFDGVVITDALDMAGVRAAHGIAGAAARSLAAGADLLLVGAEDGRQHIEPICRAVEEQVRGGLLPEARLHEAAGRVAALRERLAAADDVAPATGTSHVGLRAARAALRVRGARPLPAPATVVELRAGTNMAVGDAPWSVAEPLAGFGLLAGLSTVREGAPALDPAAGPLVVAVRDAYRSPWQRTWVRELLGRRPDAVLVALGMPDDFDLTDGPAIAALGAGRVNTQAVAEFLARR